MRVKEKTTTCWNMCTKRIKTFWNKYVRICERLDDSQEEIRRQYAQQKESNDWNLFSERAFLENLFSTRFNYFVATFSFLTAAVVRINTSGLQTITLFVSTIILTLMALAIYRVYVKLIIILNMIYQLEDYHVFQMVDKVVGKLKNPLSIPVNQIIGVIVPFTGILFFWGYSFYTLFAILF